MAVGLFWLLSMGMAAASAIVLAVLLRVYLDNHRQLRSPFTLGLLFFATFLLVENVVAVYFYYTMAEAGEGPSVAIPMLGLNVVQLVGYSALFYVTWR